jgi:trimethylamine---corrinoid protein Co-methyltransferase
MYVNENVYSTLGLNIMTDEQVERIHDSTLQILQRVGVKIFEPEALELLESEGAQVDGNLVKIPAWMVHAALQTAPRSVTLYNRKGLASIILEKGRIHYGAGSEVPFTIDLDSGRRRKVLSTDVYNSSRLIDALPQIDFAMSLGLISDVPVEFSDLYQFEAMLTGTEKPILFTCYNRKNLQCIIEMASLPSGNREKLKAKPGIALYAEPTSPLVHSRDAMEKTITCAAEGIPLIYATTPMLGATGPVTVAGSLIVANAEILSGLVVHQLKAKGAPFIYGGGIPPMHMGTSICSYGGPERDRGCIGLVRLSQYYHLPSFTTAGCTDAHTFDQQAGMEAGFNLTVAGLAGGNLIHDLGYMGIGMISSLEYLLLCNEAVGAVKNLLCGINIDEEHLALDLIEKVGPGGHYLAEEHTMKHFRNELYFPEVLNRKNYDSWLADGSKTFGELANSKVKQLLDNQQGSELPPAMLREIRQRIDLTLGGSTTG